MSVADEELQKSTPSERLNPMPPKIDYPALMQAISHYDPLGETNYYFDTQTGEVLMVSDYAEEEARLFDDPDPIDSPDIRLAWYRLWQDGEIGEELPEADEAAMSERVETFLKRFLPLPAADSHESYRDMIDFAGTVTDPHLTELLDVALTGKGAFRRFKDVLLGYPEERERWFVFKDERLRKRVDDWLRQHGIVPGEQTE